MSRLYNGMNIEIAPYPPERGRKQIMVDGVAWGTLHMRNHGGRGNSYTFRQVGGENIMEPVPGSRHDRMKEVTVYGDKMAKWDTQGELKPVDERLLDKARDLIKANRLRHPDVVRAEQQENAKALRELRERQDADEQARIEAKAHETLRKLQAYIGVPAGAEFPEADVAEIVAAMRWAQTQ